MIAKAALAQFENTEVIRHFWPMVRSRQHLDRIMAELTGKPGLVFYTLVNAEIRNRLEECCRHLSLPAVPVLDEVTAALANALGQVAQGRPGRQHLMDEAYFSRVDAIQYTIAHDDGIASEDWEEADIVLAGVSRSSKTPTAIYLANRGVKTGNVPLVPGVPLAPAVEKLARPLVVGLYASPERIVQIRENRLLGLKAHRDDDQYIDKAAVAEEVSFSRRLCAKHNWPTIDVTRRSIEETAAAVMRLLTERRRHPVG